MRKGIFLLFLGFLLCLSSCEGREEPIPVLEQNTGIMDIEAFGSVCIEREVEISLDFPAKIMSIDVKEGQKVEAGQVLAVLDFNTLEEERGNTLFEIASLNKEIARLQEQHRVKEDRLNQLTHPELQKTLFLIEAQENRKFNLLVEYEQQNKLVESGSIPTQMLQGIKESIRETDTEIQSLAYSVESLEFQLQDELEKLRETCVQKEAELSFLQNERKKLEEILKKPYIRENEIICTIPRGIIGRIFCIEGSILSPYEPLFILEDLASLTVIADVDEQFISRVQLGSSAVVVSDADREYEFHGKVSYISSRAISLNGETIIPVHITLNQENTFLKPGFNVQVFIENQDAKDE